MSEELIARHSIVADLTPQPPLRSGEGEPEKPLIVQGQRVERQKVVFSRELRTTMTPAEARLWNEVRGRRLGGLKFRRQQIIGGFIADFYCNELHLAVEVDGDYHDAGYDAERDVAFSRLGVRTLRFTNEKVMHDMESVKEAILQTIHPQPIPSELPLSVPERGLGGEVGNGKGVGDTVSNARAWDDAHVMHTYARQPVEFVRGEGVYLFDTAGNRYLDFLAGIAVCSLGHCHPYLTHALQAQAGTLLHTSNLYLTEPQARLARRLVELSDFERVFFNNSGAEANETAIKLARKYGRTTGGDSKTGIVTALNSFHGRTLATITATGQPKYSAAFAPLPAGFTYVPFNDIAALEAAVTDDTAAILLEPIQGEGGIWPATPEYMRAARAIADRHGALLIFDEVQTGMGRTGRLWAYQNYDVVPDVMTLAKGLGGGIPVGACLARGAAAETLVPGDHGSTFGGNPFATTAANAVLDVLADEDLVANARRVGAHLAAGLTALVARHPETVGETRGMGLMLGLPLRKPIARSVVSHALKLGLVTNAVSDTTLRLVPPLILTEAQADEGIALLEKAIQSAESELAGELASEAAEKA